MEILHRGQPPAERFWVGTCPYCRSVVRAQGREVAVSFCQKDGEWAEARCPVCEKGMTFYREEE